MIQLLKLFRLPAIKRFEEDEELLEDLVIENNQAIETTELHQRILKVLQHLMLHYYLTT